VRKKKVWEVLGEEMRNVLSGNQSPRKPLLKMERSFLPTFPWDCKILCKTVFDKYCFRIKGHV
jgi:hypothetical protein